MSHIVTVKTEYRDVEALSRALDKLGFSVTVAKFNLLEVKDFYGRKHPKKCCIRAVRKTPDLQLSGESQLGFCRQSDGTLSMVADDMDILPEKAGYVEIKPWAKALKKAYSYEATMAMIRAKGYVVQSENTDAQKHIHITLRRAHE